MNPRFEIHKSKNKQFYFLLIAKNNKVIATGETYKTKAGCLNSINRIVDIIGGMSWGIDKTLKAKK